MITAPLLLALHYLAVIPSHAARSLWIAAKVGLPTSIVSQLSCIDGFNMVEFVEPIEHPVVAASSCGHCGSSDGNFMQGADACIFGRNGLRKAQMFNFVCTDCSSVSGPTTVSLPRKPGVKPCHVVHRLISKAAVFLPLPKPHQRPDEVVGFDRDFFEEFKDDAATVKTFESFVTRSNRTFAYAANQIGSLPARELCIDTFRNAWFLCEAFEHGAALDCFPENTLHFTKAEMGAAGCFERYLQKINAPLSKAFTLKYARHDEATCGVAHKALIGDGHCKTHYVTCPNSHATIIRHDILGVVSLACDRRPAYYKRKKLPMCVGCLNLLTVNNKAGEKESTSPSDAEALKALPIDAADQKLIGRSWQDREDASMFTLDSVQWTMVDSDDGKRLPMLIGNYSQSSDSGENHWSTMAEIREWIAETTVTGELSDRELRARRRDYRTNVNGSSVQASDSKAEDTCDEGLRSLLAFGTEGYLINEIIQRAVMPGGEVWYQVSYGLESNTSKEPLLVWEPSSAIPRAAIENWELLRRGFRYSPEERELMQKCAGSLKENQPMQVYTNAGVFATILNCGIIVSLANLVGAESLSQVYMHVTELYDAHGDFLPDFGYDDGCHLRRFAEIRKNVNARALKFWERVGQFIFVDRFHWKNHKGTHTYCTKHCNPGDNRRIDGANTEICEQSFRWFARHKYSVNHMSPARFTFFFLILADRRNEILLAQRAK